MPPLLRGPRALVVESVADAPSGQLVSLRGINTLGDAAQVVGKYLLARKADLPDDVDLHDAEALVGREVEDRTFGPIGAICEVMRGPAQDVWVVRGAYGEVLVPAVEAIVRTFADEGAIEVDLPRGLVDEGKGRGDA